MQDLTEGIRPWNKLMDNIKVPETKYRSEPSQMEKLSDLSFDDFLQAFGKPPLKSEDSRGSVPPVQDLSPEPVTEPDAPAAVETDSSLSVPSAQQLSPPPVSRAAIPLIKDEFVLDQVLKEMLALGASDLHLDTSGSTVLRIHGDLHFTSAPGLSEESFKTIFYPLLTQEQLDFFEQRGELDFACQFPVFGRFRINIYRYYSGLAAAFRYILPVTPEIEDLGLPATVKKMAQFKKGLILVTGPTGSGKSTTLAAMINFINQIRTAHIITLEDPVEFLHANKKSLIVHREIGKDTHSYAEALHAALREDPDIILIGELRDLETVRMAIKAAEMGLLIFSTMHTNNASKVVDRIIEIFPTEEQEQVRTILGEALKGVIAQQLLKRLDGRGRCLGCEILISTPGMANLIREGKTHQIPTIIQTGRDLGMQTMDQSLAELVRNKLITAALAEEYIKDPKILQRK